jgi:hypothetical protein
MRSSEMFLELWLLRYRAKGRNEQNVVGVRFKLIPPNIIRKEVYPSFLLFSGQEI